LEKGGANAPLEMQWGIGLSPLTLGKVKRARKTSGPWGLVISNGEEARCCADGELSRGGKFRMDKQLHLSPQKQKIHRGHDSNLVGIQGGEKRLETTNTRKKAGRKKLGHYDFGGQRASSSKQGTWMGKIQVLHDWVLIYRVLELTT